MVKLEFYKKIILTRSILQSSYIFGKSDTRNVRLENVLPKHGVRLQRYCIPHSYMSLNRIVTSLNDLKLNQIKLTYFLKPVSQIFCSTKTSELNSFYNVWKQKQEKKSTRYNKYWISWRLLELEGYMNVEEIVEYRLTNQTLIMFK